MNRRPLLAGTAAVAVVALTAASGAASAATATAASGSASSSLSLLHVKAGGHDLRALDLVLRSDTTTSPRVSRIEVTPVTADGTPYGRQVVDQGNSPQGVAALATPSALSPVASLVSPALTASATSTPSSQAGASSLGSLKVLGLPVSLAGALQTTSSVTSAHGAAAGKTVTLKNLALPSVADLLAALGLDLKKLPTGTLTTLLSQLSLVTGAVSTAQSAVDTLQTQVDAATADLATKTADRNSAQTVLNTANATLTTATSTLAGLLADSSVTALPGVTAITGGSALTVTQFETLVTNNDPLVAIIEALPVVGSQITTAQASYLSAQSAVTAAQTALAAAQALVDTAQALLTSLTNQLTSALTSLVNAVVGVLDSTPLVSLAKLEVTTRAAVTSAKAGGQTAQIVGGQITGLKVLGTDVLADVLGSSTVDLSSLVGSALTQVNSAISGLTSTLSSVLSNVPSLPVLDVPAPKVGLLTKTTSTSISGGFGRASAAVTGLSITLPSITLPTSVALPGAGSLPAFDGITQVAGKLVSAPVSLGLLTLREQAAFRPATVGGSASGTPGTSNTGGLPPTGLPAGLAVLSLVLVGSAWVLRRKALAEV